MPTFQDDPIVSRNHLGSPEYDGGVYGESKLFNGVRGITYAPGHGAVVGVSEVPVPNPPDPAQNPGPGVYGQSNAVGVEGHGLTWHGVYGHSASTTGGHGVHGDGNVGVAGVGSTWIGVYGETQAPAGAGSSGVLGEGLNGGVGVKGHARAPGQAGVAGYSLTNQGPGVYGEGAPAGYFKGDVVVTGDLVLPGADYAEELTVADPTVTAGMVVVLDDEGRIRPCAEEYDSRVAGIVSGAGGVRPGLVLDRHDGGAPVALMGKLWVLADASDHPIRCGDLLTTSSTPGHAMRVAESGRAFGAIVGKALTELSSGRGLIRALVSAS
jgi:hypothetical protein